MTPSIFRQFSTPLISDQRRRHEGVQLGEVDADDGGGVVGHGVQHRALRRDGHLHALVGRQHPGTQKII